MGKSNFKKQPVAAPAKKPSFVSSAPKKQPESPKNTNVKVSNGIAIGIAAIVCVFVAVLGYVYLVVNNSDVLFMAQSKSFFTTNMTFFNECMKSPGGLITYAASYLTQYFYEPAVGSSIMIAIWICSIIISKFAFKVKTMWTAILAIPVVCLLVGMIDTQYWIYYNKQEGYWFYGTIGYFICMILALIGDLSKNTIYKIVMLIVVVLSYNVFGWYALLAAAYLTIDSLVNNSVNNNKILSKIVYPSLSVILIALIPYIASYYFNEIRVADMWLKGFPFFENDAVSSFIPEIPYIALAAIPCLFPILPKKTEMPKLASFGIYALTVAIMAGSYYWVEKSDFKNPNYHLEMQMHRAADEQDWDKVLELMTDIPQDASRQMVLLKNVALFNKGEAGSKMFKYNNMGNNPANTYDTLHVHMAQTSAPLIYYYHGKLNFASRWCIENSVEFGYDFDALKTLTRCAIVNNEMDCAKKYLDILKTTIYYKDWAENLYPITDNPALIKEYHEFDNIVELTSHMGSVLDGDNGLCEMYVLNYFANTMRVDSKYLAEMTLDYAMVNKDIPLFWPRFFLYAKMHQGEKMPVHYQEAAILYGNLEPDRVDISKMPFDETVKERYAGFQQVSQSLLSSGMDIKDVGNSMKAIYGDTFFWFYFFCRDIHSY